MVVLAILALVPTVFALNVSFQATTLSSPESGYIGLDNYVELIRDPRFLNALQVSLKWELITVVSTMALAIVLGVMLFDSTGPRARAALTLIFLVPVLLPRVCAAFVWKFAFHPLYGIVTYPYRLVFGTTLDVLADGSRALFAVAFVDVWQWGFFFAVIIVRLLEALPPQPIEAAKLDHARGWQIHAFVTLPMLRAQLISLVFVKAIESLRSFDLVYIMTRGGPGISTETLDMYAFSQGFIEAGRISYASSMAVCMMIITIVAFTVVWKKVGA